MYLPAHFCEDDKDALVTLMRAHPFATLITAPAGVPFASHLPLLVDEDEGGLVLRSHMARANDQWRSFGGEDALAIFHGPHALVHANWYDGGADGARQTVPTWNYAVVHARGPVRVLPDEAARDLAYRLVAEFTPDLRRVPPEHERRLLAAVVTFELRVTDLRGKFKLSQNKTPADRASVVAHLSEGDHQHERDTAALMRSRT